MKRMSKHVFWLGVLCGALTCGTQVYGEEPGFTCDEAGVCTLPGKGMTAKDAQGQERKFWADRRLFTEAPPLEVAKWLTEKPEMEGKFLVIEFWRTWCSACKRGTSFLNQLQKKYGNELVVIGINGQSEEAIRNYNGPAKNYYLALDRSSQLDADKQTQPVCHQAKGKKDGPDTLAGKNQRDMERGAYEEKFGVWGWPHVVILEPQLHTVVWEGYPGQKGFELTDAMVEKLLAVNRAMRADADKKAAQ